MSKQGQQHGTTHTSIAACSAALQKYTQQHRKQTMITSAHIGKGVLQGATSKHEFGPADSCVWSSWKAKHNVLDVWNEVVGQMLGLSS